MCLVTWLTERLLLAPILNASPKQALFVVVAANMFAFATSSTLVKSLVCSPSPFITG